MAECAQQSMPAAAPCLLDLRADARADIRCRLQRRPKFTFVSWSALEAQVQQALDASIKRVNKQGCCTTTE